MHDTAPFHRFRIFLHLLKLLEAQDALYGARRPLDMLGPGYGTASLGMEVLNAREKYQRDDWLGYEVSMFQVAARSIAALETHQEVTATHAHPIREGWGWEAGPPQPTFRGGVHATQEQARMEAERTLAPGQAYRLGRVSILPLQPHLPTGEGILSHLQWMVRMSHPDAHCTWPSLDPKQLRRLDALLEGLIGAFFEEEVAPLAFGPVEEAEDCVVPAPPSTTAWLGA